AAAGGTAESAGVVTRGIVEDIVNRGAVGARRPPKAARRGGEPRPGGRVDYLSVVSPGASEPLPAAWPRPGRRTTLTVPLLPPPQKNRSPPSDSSPDTPTPGGISRRSRTSPVRGSSRRKSLSPPSQVPCQSSPSTQVTPVTKRLDSIVRRIVPV